MNIAANACFDDHEDVVMIADEPTGLAAIIALHSTALGPAAGGCRMSNYASVDAALTDVLRLSQGMSYKNAMADLAAGGGKAVIYRTAPGADRAKVFEAFGEAVDKLGGRYLTAEDVGTSVADMEAVARRTRYVAGLANRAGRAGGDPSPWTALGVFISLKVALVRPLAGARIAVQGLGSVGYRLCERLHAAGSRLVVADVNAERVAAAQRNFGAEVAAVDRIHAVDADVFSPNALGAVLNANSIPELQAPVICGGANNQLATPADGDLLFRRGVAYAPDYVVNAGGIINVMAEYNGEPVERVELRVLRIADRVSQIMVQSRGEHAPPHVIAERMARDRIARSETTA